MLSDQWRRLLGITADVNFYSHRTRYQYMCSGSFSQRWLVASHAYNVVYVPYRMSGADPGHPSRGNYNVVIVFS